MNVSPQGSCVEDLVPRFTAWCLEMGPWGMVKKKWGPEEALGRIQGLIREGHTGEGFPPSVGISPCDIQEGCCLALHVTGGSSDPWRGMYS